MRTYAKLTLTMFLCLAITIGVNAQQEQYGQASYYSDAYHGKKTASGVKYDKTKLTCAHNDFPYGSLLKVTHLENKKSVTVKVIDRGPYIKGRIVDLSRAAAQKIGLINDGVAQVKVELVSGKSNDVLASKGDDTTEEYSTASGRRAVEETIKKSSAKSSSTKAKTTAKAKAKKAAAKKTAAVAAEKKATPAEEYTTTTKGDAVKAALPMMTAKDLATDGSLYQIALLKPKKEGYGVQVASLSDYENVLKQVAILQGKWFDNILISTENAGGEKIYKIILGQYETRDQANSYKKGLKKKRINGFVVALGEEE